MRHAKARLATCLLLAAPTGCASSFETHRVQAPYEAVVCYNSSFTQCSSNPQALEVTKFVSAQYPRYIGSSGNVLPDAEDNRTRRTADGKYKCDSGVVGFNIGFDANATAAAVFVPRRLYEQIGEDRQRLDKARQLCGRLIDAYDFQLKILAVQNAQADAQRAVQLLTARTENLNLAQAPKTDVPLTPSDIKSLRLGNLNPPPTDLGGALLSERNLVTQTSERIRTATSDDVLHTEYKEQFVDAQATVDTQIRAVASDLFELNRAVAAPTTDQVSKAFYSSGSVVEANETVALLKHKLR